MDPMDRFRFAEEIAEHLRSCFYIDGQWTVPLGTERRSLISPLTEEVQTSVPLGSAADMGKAVDAARRAFESGPWPRLSFAERGVYLRKAAAEMRKRDEIFKRLWTAQVAVPSFYANAFLTMAPDYFDNFADMAENDTFEQQLKTSRGFAKIVREPVGVCALIIPWNSPLILLMQKLAAALFAGCTVVVKPSPETPFEALLLAECLEAAGVPQGVVNVVPADRDVGDLLVHDARIDKVSFTGSTAAGRHISKVCADRIARVSLELGGKSASIICDDADLDAWLTAVAPFIIPLSGQACFSQTRLLVSRKRREDVTEALAGAFAQMPLGDPWSSSTVFGPLVSSNQRDRVLNYIDIGKREGARIVSGGGPASCFNRGYFVQPTIFDNVTNDMRIAREEIFGPVVSVIEYEDEDDAVRIANDSEYGLSGTVFTPDLDRAERIARQVRTGNIGINTLQIHPLVPFGGYKQSGIGREAGREGLDPYLETKSIYFPQA